MKKILLLLTFIMLISFSYAQEDVDYLLDDGGYSQRNNALSIDLSHLFKKTLFVYYTREAKYNLAGFYYSFGFSIRNPQNDCHPIFITDGIDALKNNSFNPYTRMVFYPKFIVSEFQATGGTIMWFVNDRKFDFGFNVGLNYRLSLYENFYYQDACMFLGSSIKFYNRIALTTQVELGARMFKFPNKQIVKGNFVFTNRITLLLSYSFNFDKS